MRRILLLAACSAALAGCEYGYTPTMTPDYSIRVMQTPSGLVAMPPSCPSWIDEQASPFDNQMVPQMGCANARNLALMVDRPEDLIKGRKEGLANGVTSQMAVNRYYTDKTKALVNPSDDTSGASNQSAAQ